MSPRMTLVEAALAVEAAFPVVTAVLLAVAAICDAWPGVRAVPPEAPAA